MAKARGLSLAQLRQRLEAGRCAPVYLLLGEEALIRRRALEAIEAVVCGEEPPPGARRVLDAGEEGLVAALDEARTPSLFALGAGNGPARLVVLRRLDRLFARGRQREDGADGTAENASADPAPLLEYLESPVVDTCLVLEARSLDARTRLAKALRERATIVDCSAPARDGDVRAWIQATVRRGGHPIDDDAVVWLTETVGAKLAVLEQELEKAMLAVGSGGRIDVATLAGLTGRSREHSVFELTDALVAGDASRSITLLNRLVDDGEEPLRLLPMIAWITRQLLTAHDLAEAGVPRKQILEALGGRWAQRGRILERARRLPRRQLQAALVACAEADVAVKRLRDARAGADRWRPARGTLEALCRRLAATS